MKDLTTRKIVLGMLMALVMALGVLGTADALTVSGTQPALTAIHAVGGNNSFSFTVGRDQSALRESVTITTNGNIQLIATGNSNSLRATRLTLTEKNTDGTSLGAQIWEPLSQ